MSERGTHEERSSSRSRVRNRRARESRISDRISGRLRGAVAGDRSQEVVSLERVELGVDDRLTVAVRGTSRSRAISPK